MKTKKNPDAPIGLLPKEALIFRYRSIMRSMGPITRRRKTMLEGGRVDLTLWTTSPWEHWIRRIAADLDVPKAAVVKACIVVAYNHSDEFRIALDAIDDKG